MTKAFFIGSVYPSGDGSEFLRLQFTDPASNNFQSSLTRGLDSFFDLTIITEPTLKKFSKSGKIFHSEYLFSHNLLSKDIMVGEINLPFVGRITKEWNMKNAIRKRNDSNEGSTIFVYGLHTPFLSAACYGKRDKDKICVIIPDLPEYMSESKNPLYLFAKSIDRKIIERCLKKADCFVLLSDYMKDRLPVNDKPYCVIEGIFSNSYHLKETQKAENPTVLYTGQLQKRYGVYDMIEAFKRIENKDYRLWLCGSANDSEGLRSLISDDVRIKYFGMLSVEETRKLQHEATLLVNPRHSNEEFTKYSFPSKTLEYMASGTPTLMCKLAAMPTEYYEHIYCFDDESIEEMSKRIEEICSLPSDELAEKGKKAADFILNFKDPVTQVRQIYDMVSKLEKCFFGQNSECL